MSAMFCRAWTRHCTTPLQHPKLMSSRYCSRLALLPKTGTAVQSISENGRMSKSSLEFELGARICGTSETSAPGVLLGCRGSWLLAELVTEGYDPPLSWRESPLR